MRQVLTSNPSCTCTSSGAGCKFEHVQQLFGVLSTCGLVGPSTVAAAQVCRPGSKGLHGQADVSRRSTMQVVKGRHKATKASGYLDFGGSESQWMKLCEAGFAALQRQ